jgi:hypothetical protein
MIKGWIIGCRGRAALRQVNAAEVQADAGGACLMPVI